jgi:hypothetical protein
MAGWTKARDGQSIVPIVKQVVDLPDSVTFWIARSLPWIEMSAAVLLFIGLYVRLTAAAIAVMALVFAIATVILLRRGVVTECSCFGMLYREPIGIRTVVRDAVLVTIAALVSIAGGSAVVSITALPKGSFDISTVTGSLATLAAIALSVVLAYRASGGLPVAVRRPQHLASEL